MQLLQVFRLRHRPAEVVNEDGRGAIGLQQRPQEPLQEGDELLVFLGLAHLGVREREVRSRRREGWKQDTLTEGPPRRASSLRRCPLTGTHRSGLLCHVHKTISWKRMLVWGNAFSTVIMDVDGI